MAEPGETWRSTTCPDKTPRPGREFPAGAMPYSHPCASVIQDRAPRLNYGVSNCPARNRYPRVQFSISVRSGALWCALVPSTPRLGSPSNNVNHRHGMKRLKKGKVPVKFSTRDAARARPVASVCYVSIHSLRLLSYLRSLLFKLSICVHLRQFVQFVPRSCLVPFPQPDRPTDHSDFHTGFGPIFGRPIPFRSF